MGAGFLAHVLVADEYVLAGTVVLDLAGKGWIQLDVFRLPTRYSLFGRRRFFCRSRGLGRIPDSLNAVSAELFSAENRCLSQFFSCSSISTRAEPSPDRMPERLSKYYEFAAATDGK